MGPTIITCAITGNADTVGKNPAVPVHPEQIVASALDARREGAAVAHIHVRDPETAEGSMELDLYRAVTEGLHAAGSDLIVNLTMGPGGKFIPGDGETPADGRTNSVLQTPADRIRHVLALKPDICTLDMGSLNFRQHVLMNTETHLREMAEGVRDAGVKPELEVFDTGHIELARHFLSDGTLKSPAMFQFCLGLRWGAPATAATILAMCDRLPAKSVWAAFGPGRIAFQMVAQAFLMGGHVRTGMEDTLYLAEGQLTQGNGPLIAKAANVIELLGGRVATPAEARGILGL